MYGFSIPQFLKAGNLRAELMCADLRLAAQQSNKRFAPAARLLERPASRHHQPLAYNQVVSSGLPLAFVTSLSKYA